MCWVGAHYWLWPHWLALLYLMSRQTSHKRSANPPPPLTSKLSVSICFSLLSICFCCTLSSEALWGRQAAWHLTDLVNHIACECVSQDQLLSNYQCLQLSDMVTHWYQTWLKEVMYHKTTEDNSGTKKKNKGEQRRGGERQHAHFALRNTNRRKVDSKKEIHHP